MPTHKMMGCVSFRRHAPQIGYYSNAPWASRRNLLHCYKAHKSLYIFWKFGEDQSINSGENNENVRIVACVHPPTFCKLASTSQWFTAPKFTKLLQDVEGSSGSWYGYGFCDFPNSCENIGRMPTCRRLAPQKWLLWQRPLTEVHRIMHSGFCGWRHIFT